MSILSIPIRIYYENTDAGGVVYHGEYLRFWERARTEYLRELGYSQRELATQEDKIIFVVRKMTIAYLKPLHLDDFVFATAEIIKKGNASFTFEQKIIKDDIVVAIAETVCVGIDKNGRPVKCSNIIEKT
jgi:acyl-CoA thioester hydrolase